MASAHEIMQRMKEIQAARETAIQPLLEVLVEREELKRKLAELDEPYGKAFSQAESGGWTAAELLELGAEEPVKRPKGRPRTRRATRKDPQGVSAPGPSTASPAASIPGQEGGEVAAPSGAGSLSS
ncbi:hypothetical protein [Streptomyces lavendulocolor]|uniref:hypothetical protein n=1 Tax=Streptomyces lavendulocolor TaxID=67316 RepID=UPI0031D11B63